LDHRYSTYKITVSSPGFLAYTIRANKLQMLTPQNPGARPQVKVSPACQKHRRVTYQWYRVAACRKIVDSSGVSVKQVNPRVFEPRGMLGLENAGDFPMVFIGMTYLSFATSPHTC
jgi:hypothetical protein